PENKNICMAESSAVEEELVMKRGASSVVWRWFGYKISDTLQTAVICKICKKQIITKGGNTSNLFHHLRKKKHPCQYEESQKSREESPASKVSNANPGKQHSITASLESCTPYDRKSKRWKEITESIAFCLAKDMMPIQTVQKQGFIQLIKKLDRRYNIPSRHYFSKTALPDMYEKARDQLAASLACVEFYASTTDIWSSRTTEPYLSLTVHYINSEWKLCSSCLETSYLPEDHTGQNIANDLREFLQSWRLKEENQVCVTTDSGANVVKAVKLNNWSRLSCFGHRLHIAIGKSLKDTRVDRAVSVGKKIVSAFSHSWKRQRALQEVQRDMGLPQHKLVTETPTRWGSKQKMIQRLLEQEKAITQVLAADSQEFTNALSAEDYVTVSCLKPVLQLFSSDILQVKENDTDLTKTIKNSVLDYLNSKYEDPEVDELIALATMLDPRFRTQYMGPEEIEVMKARAVQEMESYVSVQSGTSDFETPQQASASASDAKRLKKTLGSFFKRAVPEKGVHAMEAELNSYLQCSPADSESNPLAWWKLHEINFPRVSRLARKYLCIPATSAASERLFSTGGNIVTCQRSALKPATVNMLVFLYLKLKFKNMHLNLVLKP
uniref:BED-type domain-containing protein n=1 Tax=Pygocentrus nattereri TaxID=42514 RepID=A0AAR2K029_PYGNA